MKVRWHWDSFSGAKWRVISNESIGTKEGGYNHVFSSCGKNGGKGCEDSEASQIKEVEGAKQFVRNVWETSEDKLEKA